MESVFKSCNTFKKLCNMRAPVSVDICTIKLIKQLNKTV